MKHILSFSGGKDSTFLLLELIRRKYPLDEVAFFDTGWEFPAMYEHIEKCKKLCEENGIKFAALHPDKPFDYYAFEKKTKRGERGYGWCGGMCRWGTRLKMAALSKNEKNKENVIYIGIAADETERIERITQSNVRLPLVEWGITEEECKQGCYNAGFDWGGMYEHLYRLSCMYCRNKNLKELRNIKKYYPEVWCRLKEHQSKTNLPYKTNGTTVFDLEKRFAFEDERTEAGLSITSREFYSMLNKILEATSVHPTEKGGGE